jgi:hypothetical protein
VIPIECIHLGLCRSNGEREVERESTERDLLSSGRQGEDLLLSSARPGSGRKGEDLLLSSARLGFGRKGEDLLLAAGSGNGQGSWSTRNHIVDGRLHWRLDGRRFQFSGLGDATGHRSGHGRGDRSAELTSEREVSAVDDVVDQASVGILNGGGRGDDGGGSWGGHNADGSRCRA